MANNEFQRLQRRDIPELPRLGGGLRSMPAWVVSLLFHLALILILGAIWRAQPKGTGGDAERPVGVAIVFQAAGEEAFLLSSSAGGSSDASASESAALAAEALSKSTTESGQLLASAEQSILSQLLPGDVSAKGQAEQATGGVGLADGGAQLSGNRGVPKVKTSVFGIEGEGTRFLYVFDRSDSMNGHGQAPLRAAKRELSQSIESLGEAHQFQIIFYNDTPLPYGGAATGPRLLRGEDRTKREALRYIRDMVAVGGTRHLDALKMALGLGPDVLFFLTDADTRPPTQRSLEDLWSRAARGGTTIHSIQFGTKATPDSDNWIKLLAEETGGKYRYINVSTLP
ncbi:MAG: hypothetical protein KDB22_19605 [Planctomycetales bacterium]|nr:hypothetical protein [Planctomycetales bacterium]